MNQEQVKLQSLAGKIHETIDETTTAVEGIHRTIAEIPFSVIRAVTGLDETVEELQGIGDRAIGAIYESVRAVNDRVGEITTQAIDA